MDQAAPVSQIKQGVLARRLAEQARGLGQKHWLSKQGVLAWSIGRGSKESRPGALAKQAGSLN
jgi:hypothetical protein